MGAQPVVDVGDDRGGARLYCGDTGIRIAPLDVGLDGLNAAARFFAGKKWRTLDD